MAIEELEFKIAFSRGKWSVLKELIEMDEIGDMEQLALERCVEILSQTIIDISIWTSRFLNLKQPATNKEVILQMKDLTIFDSEFIERLSNLGGMRNILVHDYVKIENDLIIESARTLIDDFPVFIDKILEYIKEKE